MARILIIADSPDMRLTIRTMLETEDHEVVEAEDGAAGIDLYVQDPTDLVITDIMMPGQDGIETLLSLKADYPDIRVIVISGEERAFLSTVKEFGARAVLSKPFHINELLNAVREALS